MSDEIDDTDGVKKCKAENIPTDLKGISEKVPPYIFDHPECFLELLTSAQVDDIDPSSIKKLMNHYDKRVGIEAYEV